MSNNFYDNQNGNPNQNNHKPRPNREPIVTGEPEEATVKWFNPEKGYGFLKSGKDGQDLFIHISVVERAGLQTLTEGETITIRRGPSKKSDRESANLIVR